jgi:hypothetical protein
MNLLDLFVNNERILLKVYEALFPASISPFGNSLPPAPTEATDSSIFEEGANTE